MKNFYDVIVIGAGPAGLTASAEAAAAGKRVLLLEKNDKIAKKIYATGNGRCNYMNMNMDGAEELLSYCRDAGLIPSVEDGGRVYPRNHQASSVVKILENSVNRAGAKIITSEAVVDVQKNDQGYMVKSDKDEYYCKRLLISSGGKAGIQFGCTGDGYKWAKAFGHNVTKPIPALTGFECAEDTSFLNGVRVKAKAGLYCNDELIAEDTGEVQFSKDGISGICVMNLSRFFRIGEDKKFVLKLDLYPEYTKEELLALFMHQIKAAGCAMECLVPEKLHDYLHTRIKPEEHNPVTMSELSKKLCFTVTGSRGWKEAQVTCGGVDLSELTESYESKLSDGLFFAGEILDYDGPCGGYNIGFALKSGIIAGRALAK